MRAIAPTHFGGIEVLTHSDVPQPTPNSEQLLVRVHAFALNRADLLQRRGHHPPPAGESNILGLEIAGEVVALGADVSDFKLGDAVFGLVSSGAYAEYCLLDKGMAMHIPNNLSFREAAAIPEAFLTAQEAVFTLGQLHTHEKVLIHAGGSGVGSAAIQLAKLHHAEVFTTTGSTEKFEKIKSFGADVILNYKTQDFAAEISALSKNMNVIIDFVGAKYLSQHLSLLARKGRLIIVGLMGGASTEIDLSKIQKNRLQIKGLAMRSESITDKRIITAHFKKHYLSLFETGALYPVIDSVFSFDDIQKAHSYMEENKNIGKIVVTIEQ